MPTYEYRCKECGHELEVVQSFSDAPLTECAICRGQLRKVFSPVGVVLKGSGFYRTDSRSSKNGKRAAKTGSDSGSDSGSSTATKTESGSGSDSGSGSSGSDSSSSSSTATKTD